MKISIRKPIGYTQIGRKDQQEDAVWPPFDKVTAESRCIVLCDGVGGSAHGEIASQTTSKVIGEYLTSLIKKNGIVTDADVQEAVKLAYDELEKIDTEGSVDGQPSMATTLTCVCIHDEGILAAHMGDSRIYLVRPGQGLLYQSSDHSLVNALLQAGELTLEEAKTFPRKNVITKAIQPHAQKRFNAEVHQLTDVRSGDYIFMCCDGVLEQLSNERLVEILSMNCSDEKKLSLLEAESTDRTKDNYTAYLIPIDKVEGESKLVNDDEIATVVVETPKSETTKTQSPVTSQITVNNGAPDNKNIVKKALYVVGAIVLLAVIFFIGRKSPDWFGGHDKDIEDVIIDDDQSENDEVTDLTEQNNEDIQDELDDNSDSKVIKVYEEQRSADTNKVSDKESAISAPANQGNLPEEKPIESAAASTDNKVNPLSTLKESLKPKNKIENQNDSTK